MPQQHVDCGFWVFVVAGILIDQDIVVYIIHHEIHVPVVVEIGIDRAVGIHGS